LVQCWRLVGIITLLVDTNHAHPTILKLHAGTDAREAAHAANVRETGETVVVDVRHHDADLVHVRVQQETLSVTITLDVGNETAHRVHPNFIYQRFNLGSDHIADLLLRA
jgi:folate-dependent phosphoribosylglycinamide formyltransferase PurN